MFGFRAFFKQQPWISICLVVILIVSSYFRLWKLNESFHFQADQGRDALVVARMFTQKDLVFVGPVMSVGNIYLGPFYYYFMLPFLFLSYPSAVGPVYAVAVVSIITVIALYIFGRKLVGNRAALFASVMMAISAIAIVHSRFSWNPNIIPFFSLLIVLFSYYAWKYTPKYWLAVAASFGLIIQLHYVTLLSGAAAGLLSVWQLIENRKNKKVLKSLLLSAIGGVLIIGALLSPLILFDIKHDWLNAKAFTQLLADDNNFVQDAASASDKLGTTFEHILDKSLLILFDKTIGISKTFSGIALVAILLVIANFFKENWKDRSKYQGVLILLLYLVIGIVGFSFYEKKVNDHYIVYLLPVVLLLFGFILDYLIKKHLLGWLVTAAFFVVFAQYNVPQIEFKAGGQTQQELQVAADSIYSRVQENEPYAIVLLSESKDSYGMNYRYFLNINLEKKPLDPEHNSEAQKLFIINEERSTEKPEDSEIYEIITFPNKVPVEEYTLPQGTIITVLSKNSSNSP